MLTIEEQIFNHAIETPSKVALIDSAGGLSVTYGELWQSVLSAVEWYKNHELSDGNRVILAASKHPGFVSAYLGAHMAGLIAVPIDVETNPERLKRIFDIVSPSIVVGELRNSKKLPSISFDILIKETPSEQKSIFPGLNTIADLLFTTGTTGLPKGVALSYRNEAAAARNINNFIGNTADEMELLALPISHSFGLGRIRCVLSIGGSVALLGSFASMKRFYKALDEYPVSGFGMVPSSWAYITKMSGDRIGRYSHQLRYVEIGSAAMPQEEKLKMMKLLPNTRICMHYGLTEASRSAFISFHDDMQHLETAGKASPNVELAIFSPEGDRLSYDKEGEVCVKGSHVCCDYWGMPEKEFQKDFFGEWFRTGDWGSLSPDGWLSLKGRNKEIINVGGKKVKPIEVEEKLLSIPGIVDCACVSAPDKVLGEVVKACIVESSPTDDVEIKSCLSGMLENYKVPAVIERVTEIPRTSSGKIQRLKLK